MALLGIGLLRRRAGELRRPGFEIDLEREHGAIHEAFEGILHAAQEPLVVASGGVDRAFGAVEREGPIGIVHQAEAVEMLAVGFGEQARERAFEAAFRRALG